MRNAHGQMGKWCVQIRQSHEQCKPVRDMHNQTGISARSYLFVHATDTYSDEEWKPQKTQENVIQQIQGRAM